MIAQLRGDVDNVAADAVVVDVHGVGYRAFMPLSDIERLPEVGKPVRIYTTTYVREDVLVLYGFLEEPQRELFDLLLGVSGVGPRAALALLSVLSTSELLDSIANDEPRQLQRAPGVGLKTAQRIVLDLKDRAASMPRPGAASSAGSPIADAVEALQSLGYPRADASRAVEAAMKEVDDPGDTGKIVRLALRLMTRR